MSFIDKLVSLFSIFKADVDYYDRLAGNDSIDVCEKPCQAFRFREFTYNTYF
jgi:hypothetical protein